VPIVQEGGWAPVSVWRGAENLSLPPGLDLRTVQPVSNSHSNNIIVLIAAISYFNILQVRMMHSYYTFVCVASPDDGDLSRKHLGGLKFIYNMQSSTNL
jgi:hypothetical protein